VNVLLKGRFAILHIDIKTREIRLSSHLEEFHYVFVATVEYLENHAEFVENISFCHVAEDTDELSGEDLTLAMSETDDITCCVLESLT